MLFMANGDRLEISYENGVVHGNATIKGRYRNMDLIILYHLIIPFIGKLHLINLLIFTPFLQVLMGTRRHVSLLTEQNMVQLHIIGRRVIGKNSEI